MSRKLFCELSPFTYQISVQKEMILRHLKDRRLEHPIAREKSSEALPVKLYQHSSLIRRRLGNVVMQLQENKAVNLYYDIPSRYEIPSAPENITEEAAGTVYYSEPNRIVLFYHEAQVPGEYTPVGYFEYTDTFVSAVENNPVLEGWGNKIIQISSN